MKAWYMPRDEDVNSQFAENFVREADLDTIARETGVKYFHFNAETLDTDAEFQKLRKDNGYDYEDRIVISPEKMGDQYEAKLKIFYKEHLHTDDEIRFVLDGSGYFDIRDKNDQWIRLWTQKDDLIILPAGIYHRFTTDEKHYIHALRLFCGEPVWTPLNRPSDENQARLDYLKKFQQEAN